MIIKKKSDAVRAWIYGDDIYGRSGEPLYFIDGKAGLFLKVDEREFKRYTSKKVYLAGGTDATKSEDFHEWTDHLFVEEFRKDE